MTTFGDLLDPADRARLDALAHAPSIQDLAEAARDAANASNGNGRFAWLSVAAALSNTASADDARQRLDRMLQDSPVRPLALACLTTLCTPQPPETA
jgi:hypothetical protein